MVNRNLRVSHSKGQRRKPRGFQLRLPLKKYYGQGIIGSGLRVPDKGAVTSR